MPAPSPRKKKIKPVHRPADFDLGVLSGDDDLFRWFLLTEAEYAAGTNEYFEKRLR